MIFEVGKKYKVNKKAKNPVATRDLYGKCIKIYKGFALLDFGIYKETFRLNAESDEISKV